METTRPSSLSTPGRFLRLHGINELRDSKPSTDGVLVGDFMICKGDISVFAGAPGTGKSRAVMSLALSGVTKQPWFGLKIHREFRTLVLQTENGMLRLHRESLDYPEIEYGDSVLVSEPPELGLRFDDPEFLKDLGHAIRSQKPDLVIIDPWNAVAPSDTRESTINAIETIRRAIGYGDSSPAIVLVHHTRKPSSGKNRRKGRSLIHELAGSYALSGHARSVFVLEAASDRTDDPYVCVTCAKNNNGEQGETTFWERKNGAFLPAKAEDFESAEGEGIDERNGLVINALSQAPMTRNELVDRFRDQPGLGKTSICKIVALLKETGDVVEEKHRLRIAGNGPDLSSEFVALEGRAQRN